MSKQFKFDLHIHTNFSDGIATPEDVLKYSKAVGLSGLAITDHDTLDGYKKAKNIAKKIGVILVPGVEITTPLGDILAYGIEEIPSGTPLEIIDKIHSMDGVAAIAHPYGGYWTVSFADIIDIIKHKIDAIEIFNATTPLEANIKAMKLAKKAKLPGIGGSDAHILEVVGTAFTISNTEDIVLAIKSGKIKVGWI
ncbi:MAG: CehA/McbA family metallohydrolase [Candidatus Aenigmatarchaeota archaeon]